MTKYLHLINDTAAVARNEAIATDLGCGPVTTRWFNQISHADGRRAFEVRVQHEAYLNQAERDALTETQWYQNPLSGNIHVTVNGSQSGNGSIGQPVSLAAVCSALATVAAGSTLRIRPGTYVGDFKFIHSGTSQNRITIIFEAGARVKGSWSVVGDHLTSRHPDVYDQPATRWTEDPHGTPIVTTDGVHITGTNAIVIHPKVEDVVLNGCGFWQSSINSILYGLWTINNGWDAPDRGHGHGTYTQNEASGSKLLRNCIWAQGYAGGLRAFTTNQSLESVTIDRCTSINDQLFLGGHAPASQCAVTSNRVFNEQLAIGYVDRGNLDVLIDGNYVVGGTNLGSSCLTLRHWKTPTVTNNTFVLRDFTAVWQLFPHVAPVGGTINNNTYYVPDLNYVLVTVYVDNGAGGNNVAYLTIAQWQALGHDANSTFIQGLPTVNQVFVEHSEYDNDIAHVAIFNWQELSLVPVDLSGGNFTLLRAYRAYNAMNPAEYHTFVYTGNPVSIPMTGWTRAVPVGDTEPLTNDTWPLFGAFVVKAAQGGA